MPDASIVAAARLDDYRWLVSGAAMPWLERAAKTPQATAAHVARLRQELSPERTHLVLEQAQLRVRARLKFPHADRMFFTPLGLEQATDVTVASHKAARFPSGARIFDLCCGIGGDLLAFAACGQVLGIDRDEAIALFARANAEVVAPHAAPQVRACDASQLDLADCDAWHIDPDRRPTGKRTTRVELHEPPLATLEQFLAQNPHAAIKLAPAACPDERWLRAAELEWISRGGECRQLVAWFGSLAPCAGQRRASVLKPQESAARSIVAVRPSENPDATGRIERFVFEPDAAVLAAGLDGTLAHELGIAPVSFGVAYYTGDTPRIDPAVACFEVLESLPLRVKPLKEMLRLRGIGRLEIKKRGVPTEPMELRRQLQLKGDNEATLLLLRVENRAMAILARRTRTADIS